MWLFKTPRINSKNKRLFIIGHYFELIAILGFIILLISIFITKFSIFQNKILYMIPVTMIFLGYSVLWAILSYVAFYKNEILRGRYPSSPAISTIGVYGINQNPYKNRKTLSQILGSLYLLLMIVLLFFFILILIN